MLRIVEMLAQHYGFPLFNTQVRLAQQLLVSRYTPAAREWGAVVARYDGLITPSADGADTEGPTPADDEFAAWLSKIDGGAAQEAWHPPHRKQMYRCANCGNPSAVLRKCGRCNTARYCDAEWVDCLHGASSANVFSRRCQKTHWAEHKVYCKA
jgi:hypothetical protein